MRPNVLISSAGRRVTLLGLMRETLLRRREGAWVGACDAGLSAPARFTADRFWQVPRCSDPAFADAVLGICIENDIGLIIPTIDTELPVYAPARQRFADEGVSVCVSAAETIAIARDKNQTHNWLIEHKFPTVRQASPAAVLADASAWKWPLIAKPHDGSASIGVLRIGNERDLQYVAGTRPDYIVQELAKGGEFTVNLYVSRSGKCVCAVPHRRMEVRAGEVSKAVTVKDTRLIELARNVAEALPGARGAINVQCFLAEDGEAAITDINPRVGGGYPLAHEAGARFTDWLLDEQEGGEPVWFDGWEDGLTMLRYDQAVFVPGATLHSR